MWIKILLPPLIGAVIGYITNDLAIRMLFRPLKAYYIGKWHIPLTPGLIPKEQKRVAHAIAVMVGGKLLDQGSIKDALMSETVMEKISSALQDGKTYVMTMERSPNELLDQYVGAEKVEETKEKAAIKISDYICRKLYDKDVCNTLTDKIASKVKTKIPLIPSAVILPIRDQIAAWMNEQLLMTCPTMLKDVMLHEAQDFLDKPVSERAAVLEPMIDKLIAKVPEWYGALIDKALPKVMEAVNIEKIVEDKINALDPGELEVLLRGLMKRELSAIIWLGCILGFLMGWINVLFIL